MRENLAHNEFVVDQGDELARLGQVKASMAKTHFERSAAIGERAP